ncbi:MAG: NAD-dependent epimerase/dehydratase family protein [Myxococcota bacterium]|nr:NAD-dependent epimerase/dehydratase family protein [Myxococcota bacterium]
MSSKVLVTGGTGFVGANVVRHLLRRGDTVVCAVRASSPGLCLEGLDVERVELDLFDSHSLSRQLRGFDGVYHCAGTFDPGPGGEKKMQAIHVDATRALCDAGLEAGVRRLVLCSSSVTVGFGSKSAPGNEETPIRDVDGVYGRAGPLRAYHDTKLASEELVKSYVDKGLETVVVNPDYVIGAWDIKPTSGAMILQMKKRGIPFHPVGGKCFVDADDCAAAHLGAMDRGTPGERYLLGNDNYSYREFMGLIADSVGRRPPRVPLPRAATWGLGQAGRVLTRVRPHSAAGLDPWVLHSMSQERYRSGAKARDELGMPHTPLKESIEKAVAWFEQYGYAP